MKNKRITVGLNKQHMEMLERLADAMEKRPGEVARDILQEWLDGMMFIFEADGVPEGASSDIVLKRMFKLALTNMLLAMEQLDNPYAK